MTYTGSFMINLSGLTYASAHKSLADNFAVILQEQKLGANCEYSPGSYSINANASFRLRNDTGSYVGLSTASSATPYALNTNKLLTGTDSGSAFNGYSAGTLMTGHNPYNYTRSGVFSPDAITLGAKGLASAMKNIDMYEIVVIEGVGDTNRQLLEGYLAWKWDGILGGSTFVDALPGGHPYKSAAP
jgi:hypothetical protein